MSGTGEEFRSKAGGLLSPAVVKQLSRLNPWRNVLAAAELIAALALTLTLVILWWNPLSILAAILVIAAIQHALMVLAHDGAHYRLFAGRRANDALGRAAGALVGISMCSYRVVHRLHHNHLYERADPDLALIAGYPRGRWYLLRRLLRDLTGITAYKNYAYFFGAPAKNAETGQAMRPLDDTSPALRQAALADRKLVIGVQLGLLALAGASGLWPYYLLFWVLPLLSPLQAILRLRAVIEHGAVGDLTSPLTAARTTRMPWLVSWLLAPFQVNYHIEHHLYPSIPHYRLKEAHRLLVAAGALQRAEVRSLPEALRRIFAARVVKAPTAAPASAA